VDLLGFLEIKRASGIHTRPQTMPIELACSIRAYARYARKHFDIDESNNNFSSNVHTSIVLYVGINCMPICGELRPSFSKVCELCNTRLQLET
jgi:hypothetical protein